MNKVTRKDLGIDLEGMPKDQRTFMEKMCDIMCETVNKAINGTISADEVENQIKGINEEISALKGGNQKELAQIIKDNEELREVVKSLTENLEKAKQKGFDMDRISQFEESIETMFESEKFKSFASGTNREARGFELKDVSMTDNYTGTHLITEQSRDVVSQAINKKLHVRDFSTVLSGDPEFTMHAWQMIYEVAKNARYVSENGTLPESSFKVKEESASVKRVGTHIKMSKRMLKSRIYVRSLILNMVVEAVLDAEDFGILYGDGSGDNIKGITTYEGVMPVEDIVGETLVNGVAGSITAVEKHGKGLLITLATANKLIIEGLRISLTSTVTSSKLTGVYSIIKANDLQIYIEKELTDAEVTAENTAAASLTFVVNNSAFKSVESPNSIDALETGIAVMTYGQFAPTFLGLNPITLNSIRTEKATDGNRLEVVKDINGNPIIGGIRVTPMTSIPAGKYFIGDFRNGAEIIDYTGLTIDWADDVNTLLKNQVVLIAQEELIVPVKCPWAFAYGSISSLKQAIAKD